MYQWTFWMDEVDQYEDIFVEEQSSVVQGGVKHTKYRGTVQQQGTPQNAANFNNLEGGVIDAHLAALLLLNGHRQNEWRIEDLEKATVQEVGTVTLTNSQKFPFNNSQTTVALANVRDNLYYVVEVISVSASGGPAGEIEVTDRQVNGFKIAHTGSASSVTVTYAVIGGYDA